MGTRLLGSFYSETGTTLLVRVNDSEYSGATTNFQLESLAIEWEGEAQSEDNRFVPVIPSNLRMNIVIDNSTLETFVEDLVEAEEGRFTVAVSNVTSLVWSGYIVAQKVSISDVPLSIGYTLDVRAVDGLNYLKNIDYNDSGSPYSGKATFMDHILIALGKLTAITALYSNSDTFLNVVVNWYEDTGAHVLSSNLNPLDYSRVAHRAFYYTDTKGNRVWKSCYDVLEEICRAWGMRIVFSGTAYWIVQLNEYTNASSIKIFRYTKAGALTLATGQNLSITHDPNGEGNEIVRYSGGSFQFFRAYKSVRVDYKHLATRNLLAGATWTHTSGAEVTAEDIDHNSGAARFSYTGLLTFTSIFSGFAPHTEFLPHYVRFRFRIRVNASDLRRDISFFVGGYGTGDTTWHTGSDEYFDLVPTKVTEQNFAYTFPVSILTPGIPESGDLAFDFDLVDVYDDEGVNVTTSYQVLWSLTNSNLELLDSGSFEGQSDILRYLSTNDATASKRLELVTEIGDGPNSASPGHIEVQNSMGDWVLSDAWRVGGSGTYKAFSQLLVNEILRGQLKPVWRLATSMRSLSPAADPILPHKYIDYDGHAWVFHRGTLDLSTEIIDGEWWRLDLETTGFTEAAVQFLPRDSASGPPSTGGGGTGGGGGVGGGTGSGGGGNVSAFAETFTATGSSATFSVTQGGGVLPSNTRQIFVFRNGQAVKLGDISIVDAAAGDLTLSYTPESGEEIEIRWFVFS